MKFKTRGGSSPQGKQKVYLTGHSDDLPKFFNEISGQILNICDCAVFYDDDPDHPEDADNFIADLDSMQLVVLVVTYKYIFNDSFAHNTVFKHAIERHIPVLPILIDAELAGDFNKKCGDLQCLTPYSKDVTEISYEEKLKKFLGSVLVGDELADQVRAAFDAYIFLSYRKKDRRFAQELMRLIHKNEFCRDIAIWYDEFLTPGENFNDAIRAAMEKSELFALAVTPNLLEYPNYVMTEEYPAARKLGKKILPAELLSTDKTELNARYENIPEPVDPTNSTVMSAELGKMLENIAKRENDNDPKHNFFIGLAYLGGIDVEVDHDRAVSLIEGAAEAELPEALEKLVSMYRNGEGVERNYNTAIDYQRRLIEVLESTFETERTKDSAVKMLEAKNRISYYLSERGLVEETLKLSEKYLEACVTVNEIWHEVWTARYMESAYISLYDVYKIKGDYQKAMDNLKKANVIVYGLFGYDDESAAVLHYSQIVLKMGELFKLLDIFSRARSCYEEIINIITEHKMLGAPEFREILADSYCELGSACAGLGELSLSRNYYEKSLEIINSQSDQNGTHLWSDRLIEAYGGLGGLCEEEGDHSGADSCYKKCLEAARQNAEKRGSVDTRNALALTYLHIGNVYAARGDFKTARGYCDKFFEIMIPTADKTESVPLRTNLSLGYKVMGYILLKEGDFSAAREYYEKCFKINEQIALKTADVTAQLNLAESCSRLGILYRDDGDTAKAREYYERSYEIRKGCPGDTLDAQTALADSFGELASINIIEENFIDAKIRLENQLEINEAIIDRVNTADIQKRIYFNYSRLGMVYNRLGDSPKALEYYEKAYGIIKPLADRIGFAELKYELADCCIQLGNIFNKSENFSKARGYFETAVTISEQLAAPGGSLKFKNLLAQSYADLGSTYMFEEKFNTAAEYYEKAKKNAEECTAQSDLPEYSSVLIVIYADLCTMYDITGSLDAEMDCRGKIITICERNINRIGGTPILKLLADNYKQLGEGYSVKGDNAAKKECFEKSIEYRKRLIEQNGAAEHWKELAVIYSYFNEEHIIKNEPSEMKVNCEQILNAAKHIEKLPNTEAQSTYLLYYSDLYALYTLKNDLIKAKDFAEKMLETAVKVDEIDRTADSRRRVFVAYTNIGDVYIKLKKSFKAREYYQKAFELAQSSYQCCKSAAAFADLGYASFGMYAASDTDEERKTYLYASENIFSMLAGDFPGAAQFKEMLDRIRAESKK